MKKALLLILLLWLSVFFISKINLTSSDLGRHVKNGEEVVKGLKTGNYKVLNINYYSYTATDFEFVNHHWGTGVIYYLVCKFFGFVGLSLLNILLFYTAFLLFFKLSEKIAGFRVTFLVSIVVIPFLSERVEVRPETFSYFFFAVFFNIVYRFIFLKLNKKWLYLLPVLTLFWVNLHIYFFLGFLVLSVFLVSEIVKKSRNMVIIKDLSAVLLTCFAVSFINPLGYKIALFPLKIFTNYEYRIVENQSIYFLEKLGFISNPNFLLYKLLTLAIVISFIILFAKKKELKLPFILFTLIFGIMAFFSIRNFTIFGLILIPILSFNISELIKEMNWLNSEFYFLTSLLLFVSLLLLTASHNKLFTGEFGIGEMPGVQNSAQFFIQNNIKGPIFNNYDIGSYLVFHLFPKEKVFVDNRPEAYPVGFFKDVYIPMQESNDVWKKVDAKYNFNSIFFMRNDMTPWAQEFLVRIAKDDEEWVPVYFDSYSIIFVKNNEINIEVIEKYRIPKSAFSFSSRNKS